MNQLGSMFGDWIARLVEIDRNKIIGLVACGINYNIHEGRLISVSIAKTA